MRGVCLSDPSLGTSGSSPATDAPRVPSSAQRAEGSASGCAPVPSLVPTANRGDGEPWFPASFSTAWRRYAKRHGWEGITFHALRHGTASLLLAAGVPDAVALSVMGHADTRILRHCQGVAEELKQDAAARMDRLLGGTVTSTGTRRGHRTDV
jgi:integrase